MSCGGEVGGDSGESITGQIKVFKIKELNHKKSPAFTYFMPVAMGGEGREAHDMLFFFFDAPKTIVQIQIIY